MKKLILNKKKFLQSINNYYKNSYWKSIEGRWEYHKVAIDIVNLIKPTSVLEVGVRGVKIFDNSDTIDIEEEANPTYLYDISKTPYPINKKYDIFIALRVFHHIEGNLKDCFKEIKRISDNIIVAVPADKRIKTKRKLISWKDFTNEEPHLIKYCEMLDTNVYFWKNK